MAGSEDKAPDVRGAPPAGGARPQDHADAPGGETPGRKARGAATDLDALAARLLAAAADDGGGRLIVALAGPPGAGKSHLAQALVSRLEIARPGAVALLGMDGFHFDDAVLRARGRLAQKGAPDTFDVAGLAHCLARIRAGAAPVAVPVFDRRLELSRAAAALIDPGAAIVVVEGNYLLLDQPPWSDLGPLFDLSVMIAVPEPVLRARLEARWRHFGLGPEAARARIELNDLPNARQVARASRPADLVWPN